MQIELERIGGYPHVVVRWLFRRNGLAALIPTERGISLFRLRYPTVAPDGRTVIASGLVALPRGRVVPRGIVSWQHGTASLRTAAPSNRDIVNGLLPAAVFAGHGYVLLAPDYLGLGVSEEPHDYYLADHMATVVSDFIVAARDALVTLGTTVPTELFVSGFSEGGHASLAVQRQIERDPIPGLSLVASAPVAAAVDLAGLGVAGALAGGSRFCSLYLAWIAKSYAAQYGEPLESAVRAQWVDTVLQVFDGTHDGDTTVDALPAEPRDLMTRDFLAAAERGGGHWMMTRLEQNSLLGWIPRAPVRVYFGSEDADVTPPQAERFATDARAKGADVTAVCVGAVDHDDSLVPALALLRSWFDEMAPSCGTASSRHQRS